ncbi:MAG: hypothetical protein IPM63_00930 [Acidobacteriota bacterium]|nr:MAG: hypothetical protein IPM63_00930 [Acidobacteriota bacterium]
MDPDFDRERLAPEEMVTCPKCGRSSASDRLNCLYCGTALELTEEQKMTARPVLRKIELWEPGWNVIATSAGPDAASNSKDLLRLGSEDAEALFETDLPVPVVRLSTEEEASFVVQRLGALGIGSVAVADDELDPGNAPRRLRGLEFRESSLRPLIFNDPGPDDAEFSPELIVEGFLNRKRLESTEKRSRRSETILDSSETGEDETVIDIYGPEDGRGFRIRPDGFDFSCLGTRKAFTAAENMKLLVDELRSRFPDAVWSGSYRRSRRALGIVWPQTETTSSEGVERRSFRGYAKKKVAVTDNEDQFTRFSRMIRTLCR